ncbi:helix-turn-helix domain-containing protein [Sphaerisporangium sp. NBC_01403]|uniref:helix-turn-helix domain-containing protein n=1 Tax=Sphaerisporangium sp. NBC_01403 TaxID=2903599 RepID=UPI00386451E3
MRWPSATKTRSRYASHPRSGRPCGIPWHLFGAGLRHWREQRGLTLQQAGAKALGDWSNLARWERGERRPPADAVERLDAAFEAGGFLVALYATTTTSGRPASSVSRGTGGRARAVPLSRRTTKIYEPGVRIRSGPSTA